LAVLLSTLGALKGVLEDNAATLMRPKAPPAGKRILLERIRPLWQRMKFTHKVTARNLFRYKKRFFMTVIGIAGCTALLLTGFGLRDSISDIAGIQFTQLQNYDMTLTLKHEGDHTADRKLAAVLNDQSRVVDTLPVHKETGKGVAPHHITDLTILVPSDSSRLTDYHTLRIREDHQPVPFTETGAVLTEKAAKMLGVQAGGTLTLRSQDDMEAVIPVSGICENYVLGYVFLPESLYLQAFGQQPVFDTLLVKTVEMDPAARDAFAAQLLDSSNATGVSFSATTIDTFSDMLSSIDYIVILLIVAAAALAFVVLYNLTNINICERQKEIATLKVLGFFRREVSGYVFRETVLLSLIGTAVGLAGGVFFHRFVVQTAETDAAMFGRSIYPMSFVYAAALSLLFTLLVSLFLKRKLHQIDMVESLKAPE
jgi:putative ABC transport system permease protein